MSLHDVVCKTDRLSNANEQQDKEKRTQPHPDDWYEVTENSLDDLPPLLLRRRSESLTHRGNLLKMDTHAHACGRKSNVCTNKDFGGYDRGEERE